MTRHYDVLVAGSYFCDMVFTGLPEVPQLGRDIFSQGFAIVPGGSYYIVLALHRLQMQVGWMGHVGTDLFSRFIEDAAAGEGIDTQLFQRHDRPVRRVAASFSFADDRGFVSYIDELDETIPLDVVVAAQPRCVLLHGLHLWNQVESLHRLPNRRDFTLVLDCQDPQYTLESPGVADALGKVDVFVPNDSEACALTGEVSVERAMARLAEIVPLVIVKCGKRGALAQHGDDVEHVPGIKVTVHDTTGAGDCFNAGFMFGYLRGAALEDCLRYANVTGGLSTTAPGAQAVPSLAQLEAMVADYASYVNVPAEDGTP
ncbi:MAG: carbohydrate kinase family protein [Chloroflexi bacterium]|nr:carbohydrate kinase family protein [Chloroflexota bacterium]